MVDVVKRYICDACKKQVCVNEGDNCPSWTIHTEVGDLCPSCSSAWNTYKESFIERMRKENKADLV